MPSSWFRPSTTRPCAAYFLENSSNHGISSLHGPHHVAQKFTITGRPLKSLSDTFLPSVLTSENAGAGLPCNCPPAASGAAASALAGVSSTWFASSAARRARRFSTPAHANPAITSSMAANTPNLRIMPRLPQGARPRALTFQVYRRYLLPLLASVGDE